MSVANTQPPRPQMWNRSVAILAMVFGILTLFSGGSVLFGSEEAQRMAGDYINFVVWFNFLAGFLYIAAAVGIWLERNWVFGLAAFIAVATGLTALGFGYQVIQGAAFELRTPGALVLRFGVWVAIAVALGRARRLD